MAGGIWARLFSREDGRDALRPLYAAVVAAARQPHWYLDGGVEDSINGRFEMVSAIMAIVSIRMEAMGDVAATPLALLAECFIEDMEGQLREQGVGDVMVGKHVGTMMGALGGRLGAYRDGLADGDLDAALIRNLYRGDTPAEAALAHSRASVQAFAARLESVTLDQLIAGQL
jgi:cytochrome b pre-mRNA-processing protein 3